MERESCKGHISALVTILIWGTTFVSTKVLLKDFLPIEILFLRFVLGYAALFLISPHLLRTRNWKEEAAFAVAGLSGICMYYLLENIALTFTMASNVSVIISVAPFFTAIISNLLKKEEHIPLRFYLGFIVAIAGIIMININGSSLQLNPRGDILALAAAILWAIYSIISNHISSFGYNVIQSTRRMFFYGLLFMLPILLFSGISADLERFKDYGNILNLLYLGFGASALCFVTWNYSVSELGAVKTSTYIYLVPVITIIFSAVFLEEPVSLLMGLGTAMTLAGLAVSQKRKTNMENSRS